MRIFRLNLVAFTNAWILISCATSFYRLPAEYSRWSAREGAVLALAFGISCGIILMLLAVLGITLELRNHRAAGYLNSILPAIFGIPALIAAIAKHQPEAFGFADLLPFLIALITAILYFFR